MAKKLLELIKIDEPINHIVSGTPLVRWSYSTDHIPESVDIKFSELLANHVIQFSNVDGETCEFTPPNPLPEGLYEVQVLASENVRIGSNLRRIRLLQEPPGLDPGLPERNESVGKVTITAVEPCGDIFLTHGQSLEFHWQAEGDKPLCYRVFILDAKTGLRKKMWIIEDVESSTLSVPWEDISSLPSGKYRWGMHALFFENICLTKGHVEFQLTIEHLDSSFTFDEDTSDSVVNLSGVGVCFHKTGESGEKRSPFPWMRREGKFWALRDISFTLKEGDVMGIIGPNGAGKSTLLKLLTGVLIADTGKIDIKGRVSALLSLGAGFNPYLTGRENIYLNAMYMGLKKREVDSIVDDIIEFSELGSFIESPIKYYSSGMKARLGFSVAVNVKPEILIVDEVLATGDKNFRAKAEEKMRDFMERAKVLIIASHSMKLIKDMTNKCLYLEKGRVKKFGPSQQVVAMYDAS